MSSKIFTNQLRKYIRSLHSLKYRQKYNKFIAEGTKVCCEFLKEGKYPIDSIFCTKEWYDAMDIELQGQFEESICFVSETQLKQISALQNPNQVLCVYDQVEQTKNYGPNQWILYLQRIQDPGNLGTILRIADWYNISMVMATPDSVNFYNPKVIQSAMGAHNRINCLNLDETELLGLARPLYAMTLSGSPIESMTFNKPGIVIIGNESKGINDTLLSTCTEQWTISKHGGAESLNAAVACGIICHELRKP